MNRATYSRFAISSRAVSAVGPILRTRRQRAAAVAVVRDDAKRLRVVAAVQRRQRHGLAIAVEAPHDRVPFGPPVEVALDRNLQQFFSAASDRRGHEQPERGMGQRSVRVDADDSAEDIGRADRTDRVEQIDTQALRLDRLQGHSAADDAPAGSDRHVAGPVAQHRVALARRSRRVRIARDADREHRAGGIAPFCDGDESQRMRARPELRRRDRPHVGDGVEQTEGIGAAHLRHEASARRRCRAPTQRAPVTWRTRRRS